MNGPNMQPGQMPYMPMFPNGGVPFGVGDDGSGQAYDPHNAHMGMRPHQPAMMPREGGMPGGPGELPVIQDLTPQAHRQPGPSMQPMNGQGMGMSMDMMGQMNPMAAMNPGMINQPAQMMPVDGNPDAMPRRSEHSNRRGGGRGGGRGGRGGQRGQFNNNPADSAFGRDHAGDGKTLVVERIPEDKLSLGAINDWFKRFGTVTNVAIEKHTSKALVSFESRPEATAAFNSEEAVFNNRFVKLYWHRPREGHGAKGTKMLEDSATIIKALAEKEAQPNAPDALPPVKATPSNLAPAAPSPLSTDLAAKQQLLEKRIAEQKELMEQIMKASGQEKKDLMARLRKLNEEMKASSAPTPTPSSKPEGSESQKESESQSSASAADTLSKKAELEARLAQLRSEVRS